MSELTDKLFDHKWDELTIPESKVLRNEAGNRIEDLEKACSIWVREFAPAGFEFEDDEQATEWFVEYTNALEKGEGDAFLAKTPQDFQIELIAKTLGVTVDALKEHPQFDEIMESVDG